MYDFAPYKDCLKHIAASDEAARRLKPAEDDEDFPYFDVIPPYEIDADLKISPSKALRRLQGKTVVYTFAGDIPSSSVTTINLHIRNRRSHSDENESGAATAARVLGLNVGLVRAVMRAHDFGQTAFGHLGENFIRDKTGVKFEHSDWSVIVAEMIERKGRGLNLTVQTLEGIAFHTSGKNNAAPDHSLSPETNLVRLEDKFSAIFSDVNDSFLRQRINPKKLDEIQSLLKYFGDNQRSRMLRVHFALARESAALGYVSFHECEEAKKFHELKTLMYDNIYLALDRTWLDEILANAYERIGQFEICSRIDPLVIIALCTDPEAFRLGDKNYPASEQEFKTFSVAEIIEESGQVLEKIDLKNLPKLI
ncbi:hypothetical protein KKC32_03420 [Patescibacteria group bacterium]|nr:hypothetical protein [Patescibacteria group bacterium]